MVIIGIHNIETIIFSNEDIKKELPNYKNLFDSWTLSKSIPFLSGLGTRSILQFLHSVTEEDKQKISQLLKSEVYFMELDLEEISNLSDDLDRLEFSLPLYKNLNEFAITRNKDTIGITLHTGEFR